MCHRCPAEPSTVHMAAADAAFLVEPDTEQARCGLLCAKRQRIAGEGKQAIVLTKFIAHAHTSASV